MQPNVELMAKKITIQSTTIKSQQVVGGRDFADLIRQKYFEQVIDMMQSGVLKTHMFKMSDDGCKNLRAILRSTGHISYHVQYTAPPMPKDLAPELKKAWKSRPYLLVGYYPDTPLMKVRHRVEVIQALAERGIDVQLYGWEYLLQELDRRGLKWLPPS